MNVGLNTLVGETEQLVCEVSQRRAISSAHERMLQNVNNRKLTETRRVVVEDLVRLLGWSCVQSFIRRINRMLHVGITNTTTLSFDFYSFGEKLATCASYSQIAWIDGSEGMIVQLATWGILEVILRFLVFRRKRDATIDIWMTLFNKQRTAAPSNQNICTVKSSYQKSVQWLQALEIC